MSFNGSNCELPQNSESSLKADTFCIDELAIEDKNQDSNTFPDPGSPKTQNSKSNIGRWTKLEHYRFIEGLIYFGNDWKKVQKNIITRSSTQARSHAQKFFINVKKKFKRNYLSGFKHQNLYVKVIKDILISQLSEASCEGTSATTVKDSEIADLLSESNIKKIIINVLYAMRINKKKDKMKLLEVENNGKDELDSHIESIMDFNDLKSRKTSDAGDFEITDIKLGKKLFLIEKVKHRNTKGKHLI